MLYDMRAEHPYFSKKFQLYNKCLHFDGLFSNRHDTFMVLYVHTHVMVSYD
jgi:hypothetical protein